MSDYKERLGTRRDISDRVTENRDHIERDDREAERMVKDVEVVEHVNREVGSSVEDTSDAASETLQAAGDQAQRNFAEASENLEGSQRKTQDFGDRVKDGADIDERSRQRTAETSEGLSSRETVEMVRRVADIFAKSRDFMEQNATELTRLVDDSDLRQRDFEERVRRARV